MTTDVYPRENCIAPAIEHCTHSMDHEHKEIDARARAEVAMGRDGRHDRSAFAHGPPHHLNHASSPPSPPSLPTPPPALSPAPNRPGGRTARWAERRRRPLGPACLRRSERISCLRGSACPARLAPPACRRARSSRGRHALGCAGTAPSCHRPAGPLGPSCCARPAPCSCATPMRQSWCRSRTASRRDELTRGAQQSACAVVAFGHLGTLVSGTHNIRD